jgi:hypothetical protein
MTELYDMCVREGYLTEEVGLHGYYEPESVLQLPTLSSAELERGYDRFEQLKVELQMKRGNPTKYRLYRMLLLLFGSSRKARSVLRRLGRARSAIVSALQRRGGSEQATVQIGRE